MSGGYTERERLRSVRQILLHSPEGEFSETDEKRLDIAKKLYTDMSELVLSAELTRETRRQNSLHIYMGLQEYSERSILSGYCQP